jgi:hypothetical protein
MAREGGSAAGFRTWMEGGRTEGRKKKGKTKREKLNMNGVKKKERDRYARK